MTKKTTKQLKGKVEQLQFDVKDKAEWRKIMKGKKEGYIKFLTDMENKVKVCYCQL